jgi:hypothetical protein
LVVTTWLFAAWNEFYNSLAVHVTMFLLTVLRCAFKKLLHHLNTKWENVSNTGVQQVHAGKCQLKNIMQQQLHIIQDYCNSLLVPNVSCIKVTDSDEQQKVIQRKWINIHISSNQRWSKIWKPYSEVECYPFSVTLSASKCTTVLQFLCPVA